MKHKTSELTGALLDAAVAKAIGGTFELKDGVCWAEYGGFKRIEFRPSTNFAHGGLIIEREHVSLIGRDRNGRPSREWCADMGKLPLHFGPTSLIAAMRAFVAHKLGDEVEL